MFLISWIVKHGGTVDAPTCSLPQSVGVEAWGHGGDRDDVAPWRGCGGRGGAPILDLDAKESLHVRVCFSLGDLLSSCSPWGLVFL